MAKLALMAASASGEIANDAARVVGAVLAVVLVPVVLTVVVVAMFVAAPFVAVGGGGGDGSLPPRHRAIT